VLLWWVSANARRPQLWVSSTAEAKAHRYLGNVGTLWAFADEDASGTYISRQGHGVSTVPGDCARLARLHQDIDLC
jgi:hypothetical protein